MLTYGMYSANIAVNAVKFQNVQFPIFEEMVFSWQDHWIRCLKIPMGRMKNEMPADRTRKLDQIDCTMIELLQKDGRIPNTMIAKMIGVSESTVRSRLSRLIEEEYIQIVRSVATDGERGTFR